MLWLNVCRREFYTGDEGFYGVTALNMLHSPTYWLRPSFYPLGDCVTDQDAFAHPPFNSYFYAVALWLSHGSLASLEVVNALSFALLLFFAYRLLAPFEPRAGWFAVLLLAASPVLVALYSQLEAEPLLTTFGIMGLYWALRAGFIPGRRRYFFLSGLCLGMAFALKLWLCGPFGLAIAAALVKESWQPGIRLRQKGIALLAFSVGVVIPAGVHLLAIWRSYPADLTFWLKNIYFGFFTGSGISGGKFGSADVPAEWMHPVWYYAAVLYRDHFFLLPIILLGLGALFRDERLNGKVLWALLAGIAGLLPLSVMKVKEPLYVLSCTVMLFLFTGCCLAALVRRMESGAGIPAWSGKLAGAVSAALLLGVLAGFARGIMPDKLTAGFVWAHSLLLTAFLLGLWWLRAKRAFAPATAPSQTSSGVVQWAVYAACALALLAAFRSEFASRAPRDRIIARLIQPLVAGNSPQALSFIGSNYKCFQLHLFRRGCYWHEVSLAAGPEAVLAQPRFAHVHAFILDPEELKQPEVAAWLPWLQTHAQEKTKELNVQTGCNSGYRVFVR
jgi:4-amino-4-deoxy-L-arabinose transferase-like glycosyltransferase